MAAELVETSALFARTAAKIDPAWAEEPAGALTKRQHSEPRWSRRTGQAVVSETVTLYGVPIITGRSVGLANIDPSWSRDLFLRHALVEGDWTGRYPFMSHNGRLLDEVAAHGERTRQRAGHDAEDALFTFFDERVPRQVVSQPTFDRWFRSDREQHNKLLSLSRDELLDESATAATDDYPETWRQGEQTLTLRYRFDPQAADDGVTCVVPIQLLAMLDPVGFDWQVPGLREELVTALLRSLPKVIRRSFVPAADWAAKLLDEVGPHRPDLGEPVPGTLTDVLHELLQRLGGMRFDVAEFALDRVPQHLRMRFVVVDERGREIGIGHDVRDLQEQLKPASEAALLRATGAAPAPKPGTRPAGSTGGTTSGVAAAANPGGAHPEMLAVPERGNITTWDFGDLPETLEVRLDHGVIRAWPTLRLRAAERPATSQIDLVLATTSADQAREHPRAVAALLARAVPSPASYVLAHLTSAEKLALAASPYRSADALVADATTALANDVIAATEPVRDRAAFERVRDRFNAELVDALFAAVRLTAQVLTAYREAERAIGRGMVLAHLHTLTQVREQLGQLVFDGFVSRTGLAQLHHLPRYLQAAAYRIERLATSTSVERAGRWSWHGPGGICGCGGELPLSPDAPERLREARWLLEELRVSLFAQQLGTAQPASLKRLRALLDGV